MIKLKKSYKNIKIKKVKRLMYNFFEGIINKPNMNISTLVRTGPTTLTGTWNKFDKENFDLC